MKFTERKIERLTVEPSRKDRLVFDDEQRGLAVRVTASGGRSYLVQYTINGRRFRLPLGSCAALALGKARDAAAAVMGQVALGKNPAIERKEAAASESRARDRLTVRALLDDWERLHLSSRSPRYASEAPRAVRNAFSRYLDRAADDLDRATVVKVLDGLRGGSKADSDAMRGNTTANRTAAYGRAAFEWAQRRGAIESNPFNNLPAAAPTHSRDRILTDEELTHVLTAASDTAAPYGHIVRMLALTGQRRDEIAAMRWSEISDDLTSWTIPGQRTKNNAAHIVPLTEPVRSLLYETLGTDEESKKEEISRRRDSATLVFPSGADTKFSAWSKAKSRLDEASGVSGWVLHDLRRTLATGLQKLGVRMEVTESVLNHVSGTRAGIVGVYQRHDWKDEKRVALDKWAQYLTTLLNRAPNASNVVRVEFYNSASQ